MGISFKSRTSRWYLFGFGWSFWRWKGDGIIYEILFLLSFFIFSLPFFFFLRCDFFAYGKIKKSELFSFYFIRSNNFSFSFFCLSFFLLLFLFLSFFITFLFISFFQLQYCFLFPFSFFLGGEDVPYSYYSIPSVFFSNIFFFFFILFLSSSSSFPFILLSLSLSLSLSVSLFSFLFSPFPNTSLHYSLFALSV